ncbi:hypothetical protein CAPTEDRAFT_207210 [Capitella teleta]|uniref:CARD domain-containing protein n=1 Tax=Capitella teleta TaxID=283909 RepID=R7TE54_CAPTE|nr:hypothetical protein CAPTEDRAFT_207210 [Capitella teleta]|eukprot:ELT89336.1 hypothetical protein CAPTEDRAFT_207210 [Capitella teleta]
MDNSDAKGRYARLCRLLVDGSTVAMRTVFNGVHPPLFLVSSLLKPQTIAFLKRMRSYGVLTEPQWRSLFPSNQTRPSSGTFDALLLSTLLKFVCNLPAPYPGGWSGVPDDSDTSMAADIVRIQRFRKLLASRQDEAVSEDEFDLQWARIEEVCERLSGRGSQFHKDTPGGDEHIRKLKDWDHRAQEAEVTEVKVEGSIRKKSDDKPQMASEQTSDTLKDLIKHANQPHKKKFGKPVAKKSVGHPGMKPEELRQHETGVLQQFQKQIIEKVYADEVVPKLIQRGILSHEDKNRINLATRNSDRIKLILEMLPKKSASGSFDKFCDVIKYKHTALHEQLLKAKQAPFVREKPDECSVCANRLRSHYVDNLEQCQPLPWQPDTHVARDEFLVPVFISDHSGRTYTINDLFERNPGAERPRKVLLQGSSGAGKSTLCASVAYAWSKRQLKTPFRLAFYVDLKMAKGGLLECIQQQCLLQEQQDLDALIENNQRDSLFLLDGYENISNPDSDIYDLIHRRLYPKSTVLLTTESTFLTRPLAKLFDMRLVLSGISPESQGALIQHYCELTSNQANSETFAKLRNVLQTEATAHMLSQRPLFCLCMCLIAEYEGNLSFKCMAQLLQEYLVTLQRVFCKVNLLQMVDGDLPDELQILTSTVEEKAFDSLIKHQVVFSAEDLMQQFSSKMEPWFNIRDQDIFRVGLIQTHEGNQLECHFANRIFQEFLAAHNLVNQSPSEVLDLEETLMTERHTANVLPLYCGLQRVLGNEETLGVISPWMVTHVRHNQQAQSLNSKDFIMDARPGKMEARISALSLPLTCIQETQGAMAEQVTQAMPSRIVMKRGEVHHSSTLLGITRLLEADHSRLAEIELQLNHLADYQRPLFLQMALALRRSPHVTCLKLCWTNADLMTSFLATVFKGNQVISQLSLVDQSTETTDHITATLWSNLQSAGANMTAIRSLAFTRCTNLALVTSVIRHMPNTIEHVSFDECHVDLAGAQNLCAKIEDGSALETLSLAQVKINRADFLKVMLGIRLNRTLKSLNLQGIHLDYTSVRTLSEALKFNASLRKLDLSQVPLSVEGCRVLGLGLSVNQSLREVCLNECGLSADALEILVKLKRDRLRLTGDKQDLNISVADVYCARSDTLLPQITPRPVRHESTIA